MGKLNDRVKGKILVMVGKSKMTVNMSWVAITASGVSHHYVFSSSPTIKHIYLLPKRLPDNITVSHYLSFCF